MKIEDSFTLKTSQDNVWNAITNPKIVAPCIPGCQNVEVIGPTSYAAEVRVKVGPVKANFRLKVEVTSEIPPSEVYSITRGEEGSKASIIHAENILRLKQVDTNTTEVFYSSEVSIVGRLGKFGLGVMQKKAEALGLEFAEAFRKSVEPTQKTVPELVQ